MNKTKVHELLAQWTEILDAGEQTSLKKAGKNTGGLGGIIRRTTGKPVIFDFDTYAKQTSIQNLLCFELPQFADIIRSQPEIMDGHPWICKDFIELYFEHFRLVVRKVKQTVNKAIDV